MDHLCEETFRPRQPAQRRILDRDGGTAHRPLCASGLVYFADVERFEGFLAAGLRNESLRRTRRGTHPIH